MTNKYVIIIASVCLLIGFSIGIYLGYVINTPNTTVETNNPEINKPDGSIVIQKVIDTVVQEKLVKVKDTKVVKEIEIMVTPAKTDTIFDTLTVGDTVYITKVVDCDTVVITMNILRNKDNSLSVQAKAKGGIIVGAIDIPKENIKTPKILKNSVGVDYTINPKDIKQSVGVFYNRNIGPFIIGGNVGTNIKEPSDLSVGIGVGIRF